MRRHHGVLPMTAGGHIAAELGSTSGVIGEWGSIGISGNRAVKLMKLAVSFIWSRWRVLCLRRNSSRGWLEWKVRGRGRVQDGLLSGSVVVGDGELDTLAVVEHGGRHAGGRRRGVSRSQASAATVAVEGMFKHLNLSEVHLVGSHSHWALQEWVSDGS